MHGLSRYNISEMWRSLTRVPLVHAVWVYNDAAHARTITKALVESRRSGLDDMPTLCNEISDQRGIDAIVVHDHLSRTWSYDLGDREMDGLRALNDFSCRYDLIRESRLTTAVAAKA